MTKLSIIILSWNTKELLMQCIKSLISNSKFLISNYEVIVVDNGSADNSVEMLKNLKPCLSAGRLKIVENEENLGFSKGNNIGIKAASGQYIMLLNSDTIVKEESIEKLISYLDKNPNTAVSPMLELPDGKPQMDYYMHFPNLWQIFLYHNPLIRPLAMSTPLKAIFCQQPKEEPFEVDQLPGAALVARRETWEKVGSLDPDFKFLWEDVDWSWRARKKGIKLVVVPEAKIIHIGGASWKKKLGEEKLRFYQQFFASMLLFVKKNYGHFAFLVFKTSLGINFLITLKIPLLLSLIKGSFKQEKLWD